MCGVRGACSQDRVPEVWVLGGEDGVPIPGRYEEDVLCVQFLRA